MMFSKRITHPDSYRSVHGSLREVELGANHLAQVILGASHLAQTVIPTLLTPSPTLVEWGNDLRETLGRQATFLCDRLSRCKGLRVIAPQGSMYAMVEIDCNVLNLKDDMEFSSKLLKQENVFVLPGSAFGMRNVFRVVFCSPEPLLEVAAHRISDFCARNLKF
jgi:tyrosine aminotransferase